ncbi:hypothetical protein HYX08_06505 [Candidatus Woesearchaeota archaeon]|nr:hypothetical protein [Candidatus Woesearchaeota archaeon]
MIVISFWSILLSLLSSFWGIFVHWLSIFAAPFHEPEMFWIIIPVWVNWFFTEFFMEKHGTSFGNAVGNGVIPILASLDWARYLYRLLNEGIIRFTFGVFLKFTLTSLVFGYGIFVIAAGIRIKRIVFYIGRIRWITYVLLMFTPIIYNVQKLNFYTLFAIVLFFPLYYWVIEIFDRITPEPRVYSES